MEEKKTKKKTHGKVFITILLILTLLVSGFAIYNIFLLGPIEANIRYIVIGVLTIIDLLFILRVRHIYKSDKKKRHAFMITLMILYLLINLLAGIGISYVYGTVKGINKTFVTYSSSLVVMSKNKVNKISDVKNLTIGMIKDKTSKEGYIIPKEIIKENKLEDNNDIKIYSDYSTMLNDLYNDKIDALFISSGYTSMYSSITEYEDIASDTKVIIKKEKKMAKDDNSKSKAKKLTEPFTILLMGIDSADEGLSKNTVANGDSLILVTFNPKTLTATMLSIPRDSYVPIACFNDKAENKITHAAWYGTDCMMKTIENYFDVTIDYYAKINFKGLVHLVDAVGGIDVEVPGNLCTDDSSRGKQVCIKEGSQHLNGEEALVLARNRKQMARGDIDRGLDQQIVIQGLINKMKNVSSVSKYMDIINTISNNLDTNFTTEQMLSFYNIGKDILNKSLAKDDADLISIQQLFLQGEGQMIYDERMKMVLWDYVPNKSSRNDIEDAMKINLELKDHEEIKDFDFDGNESYEKEMVGYGPYKTNFTYTLLPNFVGYSESVARSIANKYGVKVTFTGGAGKVISQSYPANKRVDKISGSVVLRLGGTTTTSTTKETTSKVETTTTDKTEEKVIFTCPTNKQCPTGTTCTKDSDCEENLES